MSSAPAAGLILYTVGHSTASVPTLLEVLRAPGVEAVADVRSSPWSRHNPQFNREPFARALAEVGLRYEFHGEHLGGLPRDPACLDLDGRPDYALVARRPWFLPALERLLRLAGEAPTALLCAEEDPHRCHRHHLLARALLPRGVAVIHLRHHGPPEPARFVRDPQLDLF